MFDDIANDLAYWIDETATEVALAFAPRQAPFAVSLTEEQKLEVYKWRLFNPDGSPNEAGRSAEIARLGAEGFGKVYQAVVKQWPELQTPEEPDDSIEALAPIPQGPPPLPPGPAGPPPGPPPPGLVPAGPPMPPMPPGGP